MTLVNFRKNVNSFPSIFARILIRRSVVTEHTRNKIFLASYQKFLFSTCSLRSY
jgi:hypothetical protein